MSGVFRVEIPIALEKRKRKKEIIWWGGEGGGVRGNTYVMQILFEYSNLFACLLAFFRANLCKQFALH